MTELFDSLLKRTDMCPLKVYKIEYSMKDHYKDKHVRIKSFYL